MYYLDANIAKLHRVFDQNARGGYLRLDLNENPGGLPAAVLERVLNKMTPELVAQYPETQHFTEVVANHVGTDPDHICLVNGSAEGIRYIFQAFTSPGGRIVGVVPSYFMFQVYSEMYGRSFVGVPYSDDLAMSVESIIERLDNKTELLVLLNPNNPMGNVYTDAELERIMGVCRELEIAVLIDEAYHYFHPKTFVKYALEERHVFVTRTFSKLFSMAGCRLGYVVGHPQDLQYVQKFCTPHNTNIFAQLLAEEVLETPGVLDKLIGDFEEGRRFLLAALDVEGYEHKGEAGNFLFIKPRTDADILVERMKLERQILVKSYQSVGRLGNCLRVSIGARKYMEPFVEALIELDR